MAGANSVFIKATRLVWIKGTGVQGGQVVGAAGQAALQLLGGNLEEAGQLGAQGEAISQEPLHPQLQLPCRAHALPCPLDGRQPRS